MLDNERYNQAIETRKKFPGADLQLFLDEQYKTQLALNELGIDQTDSPSKAPHVGTLMMTPENILNLRIPYAVEVLGMPHAGKTTMINRYLSELWQRDERNKVSLVTEVTEGAASIKESHGDLRYTDPFSYSMMSEAFINLLSIVILPSL